MTHPTGSRFYALPGLKLPQEQFAQWPPIHGSEGRLAFAIIWTLQRLIDKELMRD